MSPAPSHPAAAPDRPAVAPPRSWSLPAPIRHTLANGITLLAYDLPGQYVLAVRALIRFGLAAEPAGREGVAVMMARLLDEGTQRHTSEEFAGLLERHGIAFGAGVADGGLMVDVDVSARHLGAALDLLRQALTEASFPEDEVRRVLRSRLAEIEQERASAGHRASRELIATMYAAGERAAIPNAGTAATIGSLTREDIAGFHARVVRPQGAVVVLAGDLRDLDYLALVEGSLGDWVADPMDVPGPRRPIPAADADRIVLVDRPGAVQTELALGVPGPDRSVATGWAPYPVLSFVIGGSPNARIDAVLREEKGFTYGIRCGFRPRARGGSFVVSGSVRADSTIESLHLLREILDRARDGFTPEEVRAGVDFVAGTAPGRYATAEAVADEAIGLALEELPENFTNTNLEAVRALTPERLTSAFREVTGTGMTVVLVGDAGSLRPGLAAEHPTFSVVSQ